MSLLLCALYSSSPDFAKKNQIALERVTANHLYVSFIVSLASNREFDGQFASFLWSKIVREFITQF